MSLPLEVVLELYDYKITDLVNKRKPQGGFKSVLELRDVLKNAALTPAQHKKFTECSTILAELVQEAILKKTRVEVEPATVPSAIPSPNKATNEVSGLSELNASAVPSVDSNSVFQGKPTDESISQQTTKPQSVPPLVTPESTPEITPEIKPEENKEVTFFDDSERKIDVSPEALNLKLEEKFVDTAEIKAGKIPEGDFEFFDIDGDDDFSVGNSPANNPVVGNSVVNDLGTNVNSLDANGLGANSSNVDSSNSAYSVLHEQSDSAIDSNVSNANNASVQFEAMQMPASSSSIVSPVNAISQNQEANNNSDIDDLAFLNDLPTTQPQQKQDDFGSGLGESFNDSFEDDFDEDFGDQGIDDFDAIALQSQAQNKAPNSIENTPNANDDFDLIDDFNLDGTEVNTSAMTSASSESSATHLNSQAIDNTESNSSAKREQDAGVKTYGDFDGLIDLDDEPVEPVSSTTVEAGMLNIGEGAPKQSPVAGGLIQSAVEEDFMLIDDNTVEQAQQAAFEKQERQAVVAQQAQNLPQDDDDFLLVDDFDLDGPTAQTQQAVTPPPVTNQQPQPQTESLAQSEEAPKANRTDHSHKTIMPIDGFAMQDEQSDVMKPRTYSEEDDFDDEALMVSGDGLFDEDFVKEITAVRARPSEEEIRSGQPQQANPQHVNPQQANLQQATKPAEDSFGSFDFGMTSDKPAAEAAPTGIQPVNEAKEETPSFAGFDLDFNLDAGGSSSQSSGSQGSSPQASPTQSQEPPPQEPDKAEANDLFGALGGIILGGADEEIKEHKFSHLPSNNRRNTTFDFMSEELSSVVESISEAQQAEEEEELEHIRALAIKVWLYDLRRELDKLAFSFRFEPGRNTVRLIYSVMRNLQRYSKSPDFEEDVGLNAFKVIEAFPDYDNPLVPLRRLEDIRAVTDVFIQTIFSFKSKGSEYKHLKIPQDEVLPYLQRFAYLVAENPYAGKTTLIENSHPESQRIKEAISMVEMDDIGFEAKRIERSRLEKKLANALASEEANNNMFKRDLKLYDDAVTNLFRWLYILLPSNVGGMATLPKLEGDIIASKNPSLKRYRQAKDSDAITLQLSGPVKCHLDSLEVAVIKTGNVWDLFCGEESTELTELTQINVSGRQIEAFVESNYLHLRVANKARTLPQLLSEGLLLHWMIVNEVFEDFATILKFITNISASTSQLHMIRAIRQFIKLCEQSQNSLQAMMGFVNSARKNRDTRLTDDIVNIFFQKIEILLDARGSRLTKVLEKFGLEDSKLYLTEMAEESHTMQFAGKAFKIRKLSDVGDLDNLLHTGFAMRTATQLESDEMFLLSTPDGPIFVLDELSLYDVNKRGYVLFAQSGMQVAGILLPSIENSSIEEGFV